MTEANRKNTSMSENVICDKPFGPGWFRFQGDAGTKMPNSCPPKSSCDTHAPGWLNGGHPTMAEGKGRSVFIGIKAVVTGRPTLK